MTTTELISPPRAAGPPDARRAAAASPTFGDTLDETSPLVPFGTGCRLRAGENGG